MWFQNNIVANLLNYVSNQIIIMCMSSKRTRTGCKTHKVNSTIS